MTSVLKKFENNSIVDVFVAPLAPAPSQLALVDVLFPPFSTHIDGVWWHRDFRSFDFDAPQQGILKSIPLIRSLGGELRPYALDS